MLTPPRNIRYNRKIPESATPTPTKKVRVGGFFGKEITITTGIKKSEIASKVPEIIKPPEQNVSITNLKPPKRRGTGTIRLCKICGATIHNTRNCPTCGAKTD